jgi:hypothetical protein
MGFIDNSPTGAFPASIVPSQKKLALENNYLDFTGSGNDFAQQYLPELYEQEVERYGNRTLSGFLRMVGAEMPMTSDQVVWSEQNRLHIAYNAVQIQQGGASASQASLVTINMTGTGTTIGAVRTGQTILISDNATGLVTQKCLVVASPYDAGSAMTNTLEVVPYDSVTVAGALVTGSATNSMFVYGSEFAKGADQMLGAIQPAFTQYSNNPIIIKDHFEINGSDTAQIGWVEVATEDGTSGYLWYLKSESETRLRFDDYLEMEMVEAVPADHDFTFAGASGGGAGDINVNGSEGLFSAIETRGNIYSGFAGAAAPGTGALGDFDTILQQLDKQGAIEENMLFLNRATALDFDDMIGAQAGGGFGSTASASYGLFDNEAEMALNFGFSGFRRGSYDFYKTDWKYLNDATTRGMSQAIDGVMIPAGTTTVYDQMMGVNIRRPFLHVRYRASETEDRRYKSWITGSVGGAYTSGLDAMSVHFLSERCLVTQAANNFVLFKAA